MIIYFLTYAVIAVQLLAVSYYLANKMKERMAFVTERYPQKEYPKLYPESPESYQALTKRFGLLNNYVIAVVATLFAFFAFEMDIPEPVPAVIMLIQMIPFAYLECSEKSYFRAMRKLDTRTKRTGTLTPRKLTDYVPGYWLLVAVLMLLLAFAVDYTVNQHVERYALGLGKGTFYRIITLIVTNGLLAIIVYNAIYGKKVDPYLSSVDRTKQVSIVVKSMLLISIGMSAFYIVREGTDDFSLDSAQTIIMSLYCLIISLFSIGYRLFQLNVSNINFDVYRANKNLPDNDVHK